jgi:hypothetical protein
VLILLFMLVFKREWARKYWSIVGMSGRMSAGLLWACINVADCCDPASTRTLITIFVSYLV